MRFSKALLKKIKNDGWHEQRSAAKEMQAYQAALGTVLHPAAIPVLNEFAGLDLGRRIFFDSLYAKAGLRQRQALPARFRKTLCPVALTTYWCDATVWMDVQGRVFLLEPDELTYLAPSMDQALEILILNGETDHIPDDLEPGCWKIRRGSEGMDGFSSLSVIDE